MTGRKKTVLWIMGVMGTLLVLLLIFILLLPTLVNLEPIKGEIAAIISQRVGVEPKFQRLDLSFFPRPHLTFHQGSLSIPGKITGTLESLTLYPQIVPLLRGNVRITRLHVEAPDFTMRLVERGGEKEGRQRALSFATIKERVAPALALMSPKAPGLIVLVEKGRLYLSGGDESVFWFGNIQARISLPPNRFRIDVTCKSNLWESISAEGRLDSKDFKGDGRIHLRDFQPQALTDYLFPFAAQGVGDSHLNLDLSFKAKGLKTLQAEVEGSLPLLTLRHEHEELVIRGKSLKGAFQMNEDEITVSLAQLDLDYPQLSMSGELLLDQTSPRVSLKLKGREVDVRSTREAALALAGKVPTIQEILDYVRGGKIPLIRLSAQGSSMADLGRIENILIKGNMVEGEITVPGVHLGLEGVNLDLEDVGGDVVISRGILEGKNLEARWKQEKGREGTLRLGLGGEDAPLHLEIVIEMDNLSRLPPLLNTLVKDEAIMEEIARAYEIKGRALGRLVVGESTKSARARVDVSEFNLSARYGRLPYHLAIESGQLFYDVDRIHVKDLSGRLGKSSFSDLTAQVGLKGARSVEVLSGKSTVFLDEIYTWLSSLEGIKGALKDLKSVQGTIALSAMSLKYPLFKPKKMRFQTRGTVKNLTMISTLVEGPVTITEGEFEAIPEKISFTNARIGILDASLRASGILNGYWEGLEKGDFKLQGNMGPEATEWVSDLIGLPPRLRIRSPLSFSGGHVGWDRNGKIFFSGSLIPKGGPTVSIDMLHNPEELIINSLLIRDEASQATFTLALKEREFHLDFNGNLDKTTLNRLLVKNQILNGLIKGDFAAHILLDNPMRSTAQGKLHGVGLGYPVKLKVPVMIEDVSLEARKNKLKVESAILKWGESDLNLKGSVESSKEEFLVDMSLSADGFEWDNVKEILEGEDKKTDHEQQENIWTPPLKGVLRVRSQYFEYGRFTWRPFHANITFRLGGVRVAVTKANLCGIATPGTLNVFPQELQLAFQPLSKNRELDPTLACLWDKKGFISGNFDLQGKLDGQGKKEDLARSLRGNFEFLARDGRIFRFKLLSRIIGYINLTEIFRAKFPDLGKEGLAYDSITIKGNLRGSELILKEAILDGSTLEIVGQGEIDLTTEKVDLKLLVAPLKTVDSVVTKIPMMRDILGRTLLSIPVRVTGDLTDPKVSTLSTSGVGSDLIGYMEKTVRLPFTVIEPLRRDKEKQ